MSVTVQQAALPILRHVAVTQLTPQPAGSEYESVQPGQLDDVALSLTGAMQQIHQVQPIENMEVDAGATLYAPAAVTLTATQGSTMISALTGGVAWMYNSCTIRIAGDDQDNEIVSATQLARPYGGPTGSGKTATVYCDAITLPSNYQRAIAPLWLPNQMPMPIADTLEEFMSMAGWPAVTGVDGRAMSAPFYFFLRKSVSRPRVAVAMGAYDATLDYVPRRLRFAPMPDQLYVLSYRAAVCAPRYTRADIVSPLTTLTVTGAGDATANQSYTYLCDVNGFRAFKGVSTAAYAIFYHPGLSAYILCATLTASSTPAAYWLSAATTSPLGTFTHQGTATGTVTVTTTDSGAGAGDPGTLIPLVDSAVESILIPMALKRFSATPSFRNAAAKPEIDEQYKFALAKLRSSRVIGVAREAAYQ